MDNYKYGVFHSRLDVELRYTGRYYRFANVVRVDNLGYSMRYLALAIF